MENNTYGEGGEIRLTEMTLTAFASHPTLILDYYVAETYVIRLHTDTLRAESHPERAEVHDG